MILPEDKNTPWAKDSENSGSGHTETQGISRSTADKIRGLQTSPMQKFSNSLVGAREQILKHGEFAIVDLPFTDEDRERFNELIVPGFSQWLYFGDAYGLPERLSECFETFTDDKNLTKLCADKLTEITRETIAASGKESAWVCVRSMGIDPDTKMRWHTDGRFYDSEEQQMKLAFCLCGKSTYFASLDKNQRKSFLEKEIAASEGDENAQDELNTIVPDEAVVVPEAGRQAGLFAVGSDKTVAVHSEPPFDEPRIFYSIVTGSHEQIEELRKRWDRN